MSTLITAKELGEMLIRCGDIPVKLRVELPGAEEWITTLVRMDSVSVTMHSAAGSEYGDIPVVARIDVVVHDNA